MNSVSNGFAPFEIDVNYLKPEDEGGAMDFHTIPCNESIPDGDGKCDLCSLNTPDFATGRIDIGIFLWICGNGIKVYFYS